MLKKITLKDFRNFESAELDLSAGSTVLLGRNGTGKSSVLEAVYYFSTLRSFRTGNPRELKRSGSAGFFLTLLLEECPGWNRELKIAGSPERRLYADGTPVSKASDFAGKFTCVTFLPDDDRLITGGPSYRRHFLDRYLCLTNRQFMKDLQICEEAHRNYNALLKRRISDRRMLDPYRQILAEKSLPVREERKKGIALLQERCIRILKELRPELGPVSIFPDLESDFSTAEEFFAHLENSFSKDFEKGYCTVGPHRDDIRILKENLPLSDYGSRGQCRILSLALKLAEYELFTEAFPGEVNVIADDAFSDLDQRIKENFLDRISGAKQRYYAFTELPSDTRFRDSRIIELTGSPIYPL